MLEVDKTTFEAEVLQAPGKVVVDFYGDGCVPCAALMPHVHEFAEKYGATLKFCALNTTKARRLAISQKILGLPVIAVYENGEMTGEYTDVERFWRDDLVSFLIGCSFSFEAELLEADIPVRHIEEGRNVPMYNTNIPDVPAGIFHGNMVVSMRPMKSAGTSCPRRARSKAHRPRTAPPRRSSPPRCRESTASPCISAIPPQSA